MSIETTDLKTNEQPSREELENELKILNLDIEVNKRRIIVIQSYLQAGEFKPEFPSREESQHKIQSWKYTIKNQEARKIELEAQIAKL